MYRLLSGLTERVNVTASGAQSTAHAGQGLGISADGRYLVFTSSDTGLDPSSGFGGVFIRDTVESTTQTVSMINVSTTAGGMEYPTISGNAKYVFYGSNNSSIVAGDTNGATDLFVSESGVDPGAL